MKHLVLLSIVLLSSLIFVNAQNNSKNVTSNQSDNIQVYYFHFTARCMTCRTIEEKAKENVQILYPEFVQKGLITFQAINLDDKNNKPLANKLKVYGQTLLIVKNNKQINLTNEAFIYAMYEPDKFKQIMKQNIDALINQ